jgi:hypothetical protein
MLIELGASLFGTRLQAMSRLYMEDVEKIIRIVEMILAICLPQQAVAVKNLYDQKKSRCFLNIWKNEFETQTYGFPIA